MVNKRQILTAIDPGHAIFRVVIARRDISGKLTLLGHARAPSFGIRRGRPVDSVRAAKVLQRVLHQARAMAGSGLGHVVVAGSGAEGIADREPLAALLSDVGVEVGEWIDATRASARGALDATERERGALSIDLGAGLTRFASFRGDQMRHGGVLMVGGHHFTNDLAMVLGTSHETAEGLKREHGACLEPSDGLREGETRSKISFADADGERTVEQHELIAILRPRAEELLELVARRLRTAGWKNDAGEGVVLVGGGAALPGLARMAASIFECPARRAELGPLLREHAPGPGAETFSGEAGDFVVFGLLSLARVDEAEDTARPGSSPAVPAWPELGSYETFEERESAPTESLGIDPQVVEPVARRITGLLSGHARQAGELLAEHALADALLDRCAELLRGDPNKAYRRALRWLAEESRRRGQRRSAGQWLGRNAVTLLYRTEGELPGKEWSNMFLDGVDLRGADLSGKSFYGSSLRRADLRRAILRDTDLRQADLEGAILDASPDCPGAKIDGLAGEEERRRFETALGRSR